VSLELAVWVWIIGLVIGTILGIIAARLRKSIGRIVSVSGAVVTAIPALVLLFWLHYPLQAALQVVINPFYTAVAALAIVNVFGVAVIVKASVIDFPSQYLIAAKVCGLSNRVTVMKIVVPLIVRQMLPGLLLLEVTMLQATLFASLISVDEIFRVAQRINAIVYRPIQIYSALAFLFICVCLPMNALAHWLGAKFSILTSDQ